MGMCARVLSRQSASIVSLTLETNSTAAKFKKMSSTLAVFFCDENGAMKTNKCKNYTVHDMTTCS
jgi:hypothetical protein